MTTKEIADELVTLCRSGRNIEAVETLLSPDVVSVEAMGDETMPAVMNGRDAVRGKNEWWVRNHKIHSAQVKGPFPNGDRFTVIYNYDVTPKAGPMAGKRMRMEEVALYTVGDGKISREEFFYDMSGAGEPSSPKPARKRVVARSSRPAARGKGKADKPGSKSKARSGRR